MCQYNFQSATSSLDEHSSSRGRDLKSNLNKLLFSRLPYDTDRSEAAVGTCQWAPFF
jgi:hypothetical protein